MVVTEKILPEPDKCTLLIANTLYFIHPLKFPECEAFKSVTKVLWKFM